MKIFINANRNGYDTEIFLKHDGGYTYGSISEYDIEED